MSDWLKTLLGVEAKDIPEGATTTFEFDDLKHLSNPLAKPGLVFDPDRGIINPLVVNTVL